jgi:hypothetical protein
LQQKEFSVNLSHALTRKTAVSNSIVCIPYLGPIYTTAALPVIVRNVFWDLESVLKFIKVVGDLIF